MERYGLTFPVRPEAVDEVRRVLADYPRPQTRIADGVALLATTVFLWRDRVVRIIDVTGPFERIMAHLSADPAIRATEAALNPYLVEQRDLDRPEAARGFFRRAMMRRVVHRETAPELLPSDPTGPRTRLALAYPTSPGRGDDLAAVLAEAGELPVRAAPRTALANTTVFQHGDLVIRFAEVAGDLDTAQRHLSQAVSRAATTGRLTGLLRPGTDLGTQAGFAEFFRDHRLTLVADRRAEEVVR
ncbi:SchA/CurD-like domain-containing protein [Micromonospora sp. NPDC049101]|uniref:SchA/CurD-like domain-containing protein n=1 Tax=unclassified Micromonospora TaxID=2617518 RepID=UPI0034055E24